METMAEMKYPEHFPYALVVTSSGIFLVYIVVSLAMYFSLGKDFLLLKQNAMALNAMPPGWLKRAAALMVALHVAMSYVLASQVICRALHVRLAPAEVDRGTAAERRQWLGISSAVLCLTWLIANSVPFFGSLMGVIGALTTAPLTFGCPALFFIIAARAHRHEIAGWEWALLAVMLGVTAFLFITGMISHVKEIVEQWGGMGGPFACHSIGDREGG